MMPNDRKSAAAAAPFYNLLKSPAAGSCICLLGAS